MEEPIRKRRGPLLWVTDCVRHRPVQALLLGLLLIVSVALSVSVTFLMTRNRQAQAARLGALEAQQAAADAQQAAAVLREQLERQKQQGQEPQKTD